MPLKNSWKGDHMSTADAAIEYARRLINTEAHGPGELEGAMRRIEQRTGIGYWTLWGLWNRRRKVVDLDLFNRVRGAYLATCERQLANLKHDLDLEVGKGADDDFDDLVAEAAALLSKIEQAKARLK